MDCASAALPLEPTTVTRRDTAARITPVAIRAFPGEDDQYRSRENAKRDGNRDPTLTGSRSRGPIGSTCSDIARAQPYAERFKKGFSAIASGGQPHPS